VGPIYGSGSFLSLFSTRRLSHTAETSCLPFRLLSCLPPPLFLIPFFFFFFLWNSFFSLSLPPPSFLSVVFLLCFAIRSCDSNHCFLQSRIFPSHPCELRAPLVLSFCCCQQQSRPEPSTTFFLCISPALSDFESVGGDFFGSEHKRPLPIQRPLSLL